MLNNEILTEEALRETIKKLKGNKKDLLELKKLFESFIGRQEDLIVKYKEVIKLI